MAGQIVIGIDLGGTKISTALVDSSGSIVAHDYRPTLVTQGQQAVIARMLAAAELVMAKAGVTPAQVVGVGIGAPGPLELESGLTLSPPNLPGWDRVPLRQIIQDGLQIPAFLENDANAAAMGEFYFGAGRGTRDMIYVTVSTGIGSGLILDGELYYGATFMAGEIGHTTVLPNGPLCACGNRGCLEAVSSGTAIVGRARERLARGMPTLIAELAEGNPEKVTVQLIAQAAEQGDVEAKGILTEAMDFLGIGMANMVNLFNPELLVIGGGLSNLGSLLFEPVRRAIIRRAFPGPARAAKVVPAELDSHAGVLGAAAVALTRVK